MLIRQDGLEIHSSFASSTFDHDMHGVFVEATGAFDCSTKRVNRANGCTTIVVGRMRLVGDHLHTSTIATDGHCDLPRTFKEEDDWVRTP
jgi:hypothetical protein